MSWCTRKSAQISSSKLVKKSVSRMIAAFLPIQKQRNKTSLVDDNEGLTKKLTQYRNMIKQQHRSSSINQQQSTNLLCFSIYITRSIGSLSSSSVNLRQPNPGKASPKPESPAPKETPMKQQGVHAVLFDSWPRYSDHSQRIPSRMPL